MKRYLQGSHPDRLLDPLMRTDDGLRADRAGTKRSTSPRGACARSRRSTARDAVAVYGGASLITEKAYLLGKFARVALGTRHIDYNGRLCMVSAGTAYKLTFGIDRAPNPWTDIPQARGRADRRLEHRRVRADHDRLPLAVPRAAAAG